MCTDSRINGLKSLFQIFKRGLEKTKASLVRRIRGIFTDTPAWDDRCFDQLEATLIGADLGVEIATRLVRDVRDRYARGLISETSQVLGVVQDGLLAILTKGEPAAIRYQPGGVTVVLLIGVNGSGKTTTAAKLAHMLKADGKSVLLAAADTFRAAAIEQLQIWGQRVGCPVVAGQHGGDAAAVVFDAVRSGLQRNVDVVLIDTAGRQHTRKGLMEELEKIRRTAGKACPGAPHEVWLTIDASTGSNALVQAREFGRLCKVTGLVLTKLDGTGKGGIVVAIREELNYPVLFVGLGEQLGDLQPFDAQMFTRAIFEE
jgi:fused signal recognition particle receptor